MSKPKLETYQNKKYFVDQYCGALCTVMYSVPKKNSKTERQGVFLCPSTAIKYYEDLLKNEDLTEKQFNNVLKAIASDLGTRKQFICASPVIDPLKPDLSFRDKPEYKWIHKADELMISVEEFLEETEKESKDKKEKGPPLGYLYTVKPEDTDLGTNAREKQDLFEFKKTNEFTTISLHQLDGKNVWLLRDDKSTGKDNQLIKEKLGEDAKGIAYICAQKALHKVKRTPKPKTEKESEPQSPKRKSDAAELLAEALKSPKKSKCLPLTLCGESTSEEEVSQ